MTLEKADPLKSIDFNFQQPRGRASGGGGDDDDDDEEDVYDTSNQQPGRSPVPRRYSKWWRWCQKNQVANAATPRNDQSSANGDDDDDGNDSDESPSSH
jgi:hypothetical protein